MEDIGKISLKVVSTRVRFLHTKIEYNINGKNIDNTIVNTLRQVTMSNIPIYAFNNIDITKNTGVLNNDYIKLRIKNLPIVGIKAKNSIYVPPKEKTNEIILEDNDEEINVSGELADVNTDSLNELSMYLDINNTSQEIMSIGTKDATFYYQGKQIENPYKKNVQILKLQPGQEIKLSAISTLGIEHLHGAQHSPVSIFTFKQNSDNDFNIIYESRGQLEEKEILKRTCDNIYNILDGIKDYALQIDTTEMKGVIELNKMEHTIGNILATGLHNHKDVKYGAYSMPHLLDDKIIIRYELKKNNIKQVFLDIVDYYHKIYKNIQSLL